MRGRLRVASRPDLLSSARISSAAPWQAPRSAPLGSADDDDRDVVTAPVEPVPVGPEHSGEKSCDDEAEIDGLEWESEREPISDNALEM
jgi:hypothetical protein